MKKLFLILPLLFLCGKAWAIADWSPSYDYTTSQQITTSNAAVCTVAVTGIGVTAGDYIQLMDSATGANTTYKLTVTAPTANFTEFVPYSPCNLFSTGLYIKVSKSGGTMYTDIQYLNAI